MDPAQLRSSRKGAAVYVVGDYMMNCPNRRIALAMAQHGQAPWFYVFKRYTTTACMYMDEFGYQFPQLDVGPLATLVCIRSGS